MSLSFRKYGPVFVCAGISIGGALWFTRPLPAVRGEDLCEVVAAVTERPAVGYLLTTNTPAWKSNTVFSAIGWDTVYSALNAARTTAAGVGDTKSALVSTYPEDAYDFSGIFWLADAVPEDGGELATAPNINNWLLTAETNAYLDGSGNVCLHVDRLWSLGDAAAATAYEVLNTSETRVPGASIRFVPGVSPTNLPIVTELYGFHSPGTQWTYSWTNSVRTNGWWKQAGIGTNIYLFGCEELEGEKASVSIVYGSGYTVLTNELSFPYWDWSTARHTALAETSGSNWTGAAAVKVSSTGRSNGWFVVADVAAGVAPCTTYDYGTYDLKRIFEITSGSSITLEVYPYPVTPGVTRTISFTGQGCSVSPASYTWSTIYNKRTLTVTLASGAGTVKMSESGQLDGYIAVINTGAGASGWTISPVKSSVAVGASASVAIHPDTAWTNTTIVARRQTVTTNDLDEARGICTNLMRTICIFQPGELLVSNAMVYAGETNITEALVDQIGSAPDLDGFSYLTAKTEACPEISADVDDVTLMGGIGNQTYTFASWTLAASANSYEWFDGVDLRYNFSHGANVSYLSRHWQGCRAPYPSEWACASGYVSRVTVFACVAAGSDPYLYTGGFSGTNAGAARMTFVSSGRQGLCTNVFGLFSFPALPASPITNAFSYTAAQSDTVYSALYHEPGSWKFSLIGAWDNPSAVPRFDLGARTLPDPLDDAANWREWITDDAEGDWHEHDWDYRYGQAVYLRAIVVVVDWNWRHLNNAVPFTPENWTPEWVTANTNPPAK